MSFFAAFSLGEPNCNECAPACLPIETVERKSACCEKKGSTCVQTPNIQMLFTSPHCDEPPLCLSVCACSASDVCRPSAQCDAVASLLFFFLVSQGYHELYPGATQKHVVENIRPVRPESSSLSSPQGHRFEMTNCPTCRKPARYTRRGGESMSHRERARTVAGHRPRCR